MLCLSEAILRARAQAQRCIQTVGRAVFAALLLCLVALQKELFCAVMFLLNKGFNIWGFFQKLYFSKLKLTALHRFLAVENY